MARESGVLEWESDVYPDKSLSLDRYLIVEPNESWQIFNWVRCFTLGDIETELKTAGPTIDQLFGDLSGAPLNPECDHLVSVTSV